jgi:hypothetical protein
MRKICAVSASVFALVGFLISPAAQLPVYFMAVAVVWALLAIAYSPTDGKGTD